MIQFIILLYKDFTLKRRHYIMTSCELILPILFACLPLLFLSIYNDQPELLIIDKTFDEYYNSVNDSSWPQLSTMKYNLSNPFDVPSLFKAKNVTLQFFYTPMNNLTNNLMENAVKLFMLKTQFYNITVKGLSHEIELSSLSIIFETYPVKVISTIFHNINDILPDTLNYTIRSGVAKHITALQYTEILDCETLKETTYTESFFLGWQAALEQTFIRLRVGENKSHYLNVFLQAFPAKGERYSSSLMYLLDLWPSIFSFGFFMYASIVTYRITLEKTLGMQALMNSMGLTQFSYWISYFTSNFLEAVLISFIISLIYQNLHSEEILIFRKTNFYILWLLILIYMINLILFCFIITIFFCKPRSALLFIFLSYVVTYCLMLSPYYYGEDYTYLMNLKYGLKLFICIVPMSSVFYTFELLFILETGGSGISWFFITNPGKPYYDLSVLILGNTISFFTLIILLWYLDAVWPSEGRISQPIYFPFTIKYWFGSLFFLKRIENEDLDLDSEIYEPNFSSSYPSVVIQNITKCFDQIWSSNTVIDKLSFKIYSKQITILMGMKNSGKTTLCRILSGLSKPNHGKIFINGLDLYSNLPKVRKFFGICPENSVLYETLTVHEQLTVFAGLKGVKLQEITEQVLAVEEILELSAYKNDLANELSYECKRKLNLGLAVVGKTEILLLDEPTRGMCSDSRYHFWSVLQRLKRDHTIFLTSSSINDVYNFADKIALFSYGRLLICGSLNFLNDKLGVGYKLHITKDMPFHLTEVLEVTHKYYRDAVLEKETENSAIINLKSVINIRLGSLFEELENIGEKIGVKSCGISMEPLEVILMNESYITFLMNKDSELVDDENFNDKDLYIFQRYFKTSPWSLHFSRLSALFYKRAVFMLRLWGLVVLHLLIPFILMSVGFLLLQYYHISEFPTFDLNLKNVYSKHIYGFVEIYPNDSSTAKSIIQNELLKVMEENRISVYTHNDVKELISLYSYVFYPHYFKGLLVGGSVLQKPSGPLFVAWYNSKCYHTIPVALNLIHTAILRHFTGNGSIHLTHYPLPCSYISCTDHFKSQIIILTVIPLVAAFIGASNTFIPIYERTSKAKLLQLMSGLSVNLYWLSTLLWDIFILIGVSLFFILAAYVFYPYYIQDSGSFGAIYLIFFVFGWCTIPISYLMSLVFDRPVNTSVYLFLFYSISGLFSILVHAEQIYVPDAIIWIFCVFPSFTVTEGLYKIFYIPLITSFCYAVNDKILEEICHKKNNFTQQSPFFKCCRNFCEGNECEGYLNFISFDLQIGILKEVLIMFVIGSLLLLLLKLLEAAIYQSYKGFILAKPLEDELNRKNNGITSTGVYSERERIEDALASGNHDETLMVLNLTKYYGSLCAVNNLTFGVNVGESFGIVGGNGAGKSSLFKMISGEIVPTAGNSFIKEYNLVNNLQQFQSYVGYCPQYDALLNHLTGREMLRFISKLRGVVTEDFLPILIKMIEIEDIADQLIKHYSFANKRKLAVAAATMGSPLILIMDEPTTGIDFKSKRIIWNLLNKIKSCNLSAIIFSCSSILECQKLNQIGFCTKLAVIDQGTFQCIGSLEKLEEIYNAGKIVKIMIKQESLDLTCIFKAKGFFESIIPKATLLAYHKGSFTYHIGEPYLTLSALFHLMEFMKIKLNLHQYLINDSSLRNICLSYIEKMYEY